MGKKTIGNRKKKRRAKNRRKIVLNVSVAKRRKSRAPGTGGWSRAERRKAKAAIAAVCAVVLIAAAHYAGALEMLRPAGFTVRWVEIGNEDLLSEGEVVRLSGINFGEGLLSLDLGGVRSRICAHPDVRDAVVVRSLPSGIRIKVFERFPVAAVHRGRRYVIDGAGHILSERKERRHRSLPLLVGCAAECVLKPGVRIGSREVLGALAIVKKYRETELFRLMELMSVDVRDADNLVLHTQDISEIRLGSGDLESRLDLLAYILKQRKSHGLDRPARYLDLRWEDVAEMPEKQLKVKS